MTIVHKSHHHLFTALTDGAEKENMLVCQDGLNTQREDQTTPGES